MYNSVMTINSIRQCMSDGRYANPTWNDTERCPFCQDELSDGGPGFIDHIEASDDCAADFDGWRGRVADDMARGWSG